MMMSGLRTFALAFLLGGWSAVAAGAEPAPGLASLNSDLARLTLRQAEIFFGRRELDLQPARAAALDYPRTTNYYLGRRISRNRG